MHRSPSSFSSPGSQLSRLRSSNIVKDIGAGIAHIKRNVGQRFYLQTYHHQRETVRQQGHDRSGHLKKWTDILIPHSCRHQQPSPWAKLEPTGIGTYAPNCLYKDIFHRTISLQVIWRKVKVWAKLTKRQGGQFRIYCYGSKGQHQLVEVNPLYTCHKQQNKTHKPQNRGSEASPSADGTRAQVPSLRLPRRAQHLP